MAQISKAPPTSRTTYPWPEWLDGKARDLKQGEDFTVVPWNLKAAAYQAAKRLDVRVIVNIVDNATIRIQAILPNVPAKKTKPKRKAG